MENCVAAEADTDAEEEDGLLRGSMRLGKYLLAYDDVVVDDATTLGVCASDSVICKR